MKIELREVVGWEILRCRIRISAVIIPMAMNMISKVKKKDIRRIAKRLIDTDNMVFVVVANAADVKDDLEKLGTVTVKHIDEF